MELPEFGFSVRDQDSVPLSRTVFLLPYRLNSFLPPNLRPVGFSLSTDRIIGTEGPG